VKVREGALPPLKNLFPLSFEGEGDTGGEVEYKTNSPSPYQGEGEKGDRDTNKNLRG